jgi:hypothetical protein
MRAQALHVTSELTVTAGEAFDPSGDYQREVSATGQGL